MQLHVCQLSDIQIDGVTVLFNSPIGSASARWVGEEPVVGGEYEVELDIPGVLRWNIEISEIQTSAESIFEDNGQVCILGRLKSIDEDGVAVVQLCDDIIFVEVDGAPSVVPCGVLIRTPSLQLFDVRL